jgi:hypothetical protein
MSWGVLQFDMNLGDIGSQKDPKIVNLENQANSMFKTSNDCITLDINIKKAKDFLSDLTKERLSGYKVNMTKPSEIKNVSYAYAQTYKTAYDNRAFYVNNMISIVMPKKILELENSFLLLDCRNQIEKKRLDESGQILTKQSFAQEKNVLTSNYNEQYIYIGLGALVLLVGLYVISKK